MADWFGAYAQQLEARLGTPGPGVRLDDAARNPLLELARVVAHGTERKNAPLATYVAGRYVALRTGQGVSAATAVAEAVDCARAALEEEA